jgi:hypothetical protein
MRGRQAELLALRELINQNLLGDFVIPVVEPIKTSSTFVNTIKTYNDKNKPIAIILNPTVGELSFKSLIDSSFFSFMKTNAVSTPIIPSVIMDKNTDEIVQWLKKQDYLNSNILVLITNCNYLESYKILLSSISPKYMMFPDERQIHRVIAEAEVNTDKVLFEDKFNKRAKNADYLKQEDEFFSDDLLYFKNEGYVGVGDYSILGKEYVEGGFSPYAVAIHIVYFADDKTLRIRHFVSDSNDDTSDVARKFHEAVLKLKKWSEGRPSNQLTLALSTLIHYADTGYYPGLSTLKKLSIMHHLELVGKYLKGGLEE